MGYKISDNYVRKGTIYSGGRLNYQHVIAKMYRFLLEMNIQDEYTKDFMTKWINVFGYNI